MFQGTGSGVSISAVTGAENEDYDLEQTPDHKLSSLGLLLDNRESSEMPTQVPKTSVIGEPSARSRDASTSVLSHLLPTEVRNSRPRSEDARSPKAKKLKKVLEDLSIQLMEASNRFEMDSQIVQRLKACFVFNSSTYRKDTDQYRINPREHVARVWEWALLDPNWRVDAWNASSLIDDEEGLANVFLTSTMSGYFGDLACERVSQIRWRRRKGNWNVVELRLMNGGGSRTF